MGVISAPNGEFQRVERWVAVLRRRMGGGGGGGGGGGYEEG